MYEKVVVSAIPASILLLRQDQAAAIQANVCAQRPNLQMTYAPAISPLL